MAMETIRKISEYYAYFNHSSEQLLTCKEVLLDDNVYRMYYLIGSVLIGIKIGSCFYFINVQSDKYIIYHSDQVEIYQKDNDTNSNLIEKYQIIGDHIITQDTRFDCVKSESEEDHSHRIIAINVFYEFRMCELFIKMDVDKLLQLIEQWTTVIFGVVLHLLNNGSKQHFSTFLKFDTWFIKNATLILLSLNRNRMITSYIDDNLLHLRVPDKYQLTIKYQKDKITDIMILMKNGRVYYHNWDNKLMFSDGVNKIKSNW